MPVRNLSFDEVIDGLTAQRRPHFKDYLAMYSSWFGGIITDPALMMVPLDDHLVHRGDGIFEAFKCSAWKVYALSHHLDRLEKSASALALALPVSRPALTEIILETIRAGNSADCLIRLFVSRGPGGFSVNPKESIASQVYVVVTAFPHPAPEDYERGVVLATSPIPVRIDRFATIKTCNYLHNVLMKLKANEAGVDYAVSLDENGFLAESATENVGIVTRGGEFLMPRFAQILKGTTITRAAELANGLLGRELTSVAEADIPREQAYDAAEMLVFGTGMDVLPVVEYDGRTIGDGKPGPVFKRLLELLLADQTGNAEMLTPVKGA